MSVEWAKVLDIVRVLPVWLFAALAATGLFVLYAPAIPGLDLAAGRSWPWISPATVLVTALLLARIGAAISDVVRSHRAGRKGPSLVLTVHPERNRAYWAATEQTEGSFNTQLVLDLVAHNETSAFVRLTALRLIGPRIAHDRIQTAMFMVSSPLGTAEFSSDHPVRGKATAKLRLVVMLAGELGRAGQVLPVVFGLKDQRGYEHRIKARLWPA